jgi:hypothetical protein
VPGLAILFGATLAAQSTLSIERLAFHQYEDGPVLASSYEFLPGETAWFSCRIAGFGNVREGDEQHVRLSWEMRPTDAGGVLLQKPLAGRIQDRLLPEDKDWRPKFLATLQIPPFALGGTYRIAVTVADEVTGARVSQTLEFPVKGPAGYPASPLAIYDFRFLRNENDAAPLKPPAYRAPAMLWARFDIAGFRLAENNRFDIGYGLAVLAADSKLLFTQAEAAGQSKESFYPQRWAPGALSLNVESGTPAGTYTLVVIVRDKLSGETAELREQFRVE